MSDDPVIVEITEQVVETITVVVEESTPEVITVNVDENPGKENAGVAEQLVDAHKLEVAASLLTKENVGVAKDLFDSLDRSANWTLTRDTGFSLRHEQTTQHEGEKFTGDWGWPAFPDITGGFLKGTDGVVRHYSSGLPTAFEVGVTTVSGSDLYSEPRQSVVVTDYPPTVDYCSGGPILDLGNGVGFMILHLEWKPYNPIDFYWTLAAAKVTDIDGEITITYLGEIITHEITKEDSILNEVQAGQGAGHFMIHDGYIYVYHTDHNSLGEFRPGLSRCSLVDIESAIDSETPEAPVFNKWNGEGLNDIWSTPSLGGSSADYGSVPAAVTLSGDILTLPDGRHLWVSAFGLTSGADWGVFYNVASDPLNWEWTFPDTEYRTILETQDVYEYIYGTLWSGDEHNPKTATRQSVHFPFVRSADLVGRWGDYSVQNLELWPVTSPEIFDLELDPAIQPERLYPSGDSVVDLTAIGTEGGPGRVYQYTAPADITLKAMEDVVEYWEILHGAPDGVITIHPADGDPDFNGGAFESIELYPEEVAHIVYFPEGNSLITWRSSTGTRVVPSVFSATIMIPFPVDGTGGVVSDGVLTLAFLDGVFPINGKALLHLQTNSADDGMYIASEPNTLDPTKSNGVFHYMPEHQQPFRAHGVGLPVMIGTNFLTGSPFQGTVFTADGVVWELTTFVYNPANGTAWSDIHPVTISNALDRIAAHIGPIP